MNITIIGTGNMAKGIAARLLSGGHSVVLHTRDQAKGDALIADLSSLAVGDAKVTTAPIGSAPDQIVILAVHYGEPIQAVASEYGRLLEGKVLVDITNPVDFETFQLIPDAGTSGAEEIASLFKGSKVIKAFNTVFAGSLFKGEAGGREIDVFVAGDDADAKKLVSELVKSGGMRPLDVGPLANARHLEGIALIHMSLQDQVQGNWVSGIKIVT